MLASSARRSTSGQSSVVGTAANAVMAQLLGWRGLPRHLPGVTRPPQRAETPGNTLITL
jgi:hypothetical protein